MKNIWKKTAAIGLSVMMAAAMAACGGSSSDKPAQTEAAAGGDASYTVGVCQLVQHVALDAATQGFQDAITEAFGDSVTFDVQNAQGDSNTCSTIINGLVSNNVDLILANATPALQAAQAGTDSIPVLGTSITDYATALAIDDFSGTVGGNISGTSDLAPLDGQAEMFKELLPDAKKIGMIYCSAEANSQYQVDTIKGYLEGMGYTCEYYAFSDSNDISTIVTKASQECDALYIPTDNTAASNTEIINNICEPAGIPIIAGEEGICKGCGIATLSIDYYDLGYATGQMGVKVLQGEDISTMAIEYAPNFTKEYMADRCEKLGITVPEDYLAIEADAE
jgi:putative ABC transport system substrate-binding protein